MLSVALALLCIGIGHLKSQEDLGASQFVFMDLMVIDERGRSIHGARLELGGASLGTTDSHGRWAKMVKIPVDKPITLAAQKQRMGREFRRSEKILANKKNLVENQYRLSKVVQIRRHDSKLF
jgi:hypothetical protein